MEVGICKSQRNKENYCIVQDHALSLSQRGGRQAVARVKEIKKIIAQSKTMLPATHREVGPPLCEREGVWFPDYAITAQEING